MLVTLRLFHFKQSFSYQQFVRFASALKRATADFNEDVLKTMEDNETKPRKHPGIMPHGPYLVPKHVKSAISKLIADTPQKQLLTEAQAFSKFLLSRELPKEAAQILSIQTSIEAEIEESMPKNVDATNEEDVKRYDELKEAQVRKVLKQRVYNWSRLDFSKYLCLLYLVTRSAPEFAAVSQVLSQIDQRTSFQPKSIFDFGSGVGTVIWAAEAIWGKTINEYYCVDSSSNMIDLLENIINGYNDKKFTTKIFQRQFLPSSNEISSDIVVSAFSLLELPNSETRLETIKNLWRRTNKFLVLIESGTLAGFSIINEAREFLLSTKSGKTIKEANVFAPCPHDFSCPRSASRNICYFEAGYLSFPQKPEKPHKERFSYVVFEKGANGRERADNNWPRIIQPVLCKSGHTICRFCTAEGKLKEVIFTANKCGKIPYRCARSSSWGDLFPCKILEKQENSLPPQKENTS